MSNTAIFFGSTTGNTEAAAKQLAEKLDADVFDVASSSASDLSKYNNLVLGTSTWGIGDLQDDWDDFISDLMDADLSGKVIALYGCGDGMSYSDSFVDGIGIIYKQIKDKGCKLVGAVDTDSYDYDSSTAEIDGKFVGLPLDDNQPALTAGRIASWADQIKSEFI